MNLPTLVPYVEAKVDPVVFGNFLNPIIKFVIYPIVELMFAVAVIVFVYGVFEMIVHGDDSEARTKGRNSMIGGIIGIFVMVSAWAIVYVIAQTVSGLK